MDTKVPQASPAATRLFACFSRFEFALKESGYVRANRSGGAEPDWERFSEIDGLQAIMQRLRAKGAAAELFRNPPKQQVMDGNHWAWADPPPVLDGKSFVRAIKRVRNNLFHGGKSGPDPRDDQLCEDAVVCLMALLELDPEVSSAFSGEY